MRGLDPVTSAAPGVKDEVHPMPADLEPAKIDPVKIGRIALLLCAQLLGGVTCLRAREMLADPGRCVRAPLVQRPSGLPARRTFLLPNGSDRS